jgi:hypothetical protein
MCFLDQRVKADRRRIMDFGNTTRLKIGLILGCLGMLLAIKPDLCRGQAEINPDYYEINNDIWSHRSTARETNAVASTFRGEAEPILPQQFSTGAIIRVTS